MRNFLFAIILSVNTFAMAAPLEKKMQTGYEVKTKNYIEEKKENREASEAGYHDFASYPNKNDSVGGASYHHSENSDDLEVVKPSIGKRGVQYPEEDYFSDDPGTPPDNDASYNTDPGTGVRPRGVQYPEEDYFSDDPGTPPPDNYEGTSLHPEASEGNTNDLPYSPHPRKGIQFPEEAFFAEHLASFPPNSFTFTEGHKEIILPRNSYPEFEYYSHPDVITYPPIPDDDTRLRGINEGWPVYNTPPFPPNDATGTEEYEGNLPQNTYPEFDYFTDHPLTYPPIYDYDTRPRGRNGGWPVYNTPPEEYSMSDPDIPPPPPLPDNRYRNKFRRGGKRDWQPKITMPEDYFLSNPDIPTPPRWPNNRYRNNLRKNDNPYNRFYYQ